LAQRDDLLLLFFAQDIAHVDGGYASRLSNVLTAFSLAGFQVTTIGRFWVTAEECLSSYEFAGSGATQPAGYFRFGAECSFMWVFAMFSYWSVIQFRI
jgi:hypothetical protein